MMRHYQNRVARKATRKAILSSTSTGIIAWIRTFNRLQLGLALGSLATSVLLLFIGTYVYFDASIVANSGSSPTAPGRTAVYDTILALYGIDEKAFTMLYPQEERVQLARLHQSTANSSSNLKLINYQIGLSMMFVGAVSILLEVGLVFAVLFEHFKLSVLYSLLMAASLAYGLLAGSSGQRYALSITGQIGLFLSFVVFSLGIKVKRRAADLLLLTNGSASSSSLQNIELIGQADADNRQSSRTEKV